MKSFTIAYITGRANNEWSWFRDSMLREFDRCGITADIMVVDLHAKASVNIEEGIALHPVKPNIWQGPSRITKEDWWAKSNAINTAICLCQTKWICFFDDRCVLAPGYMDALSDAMDGNYILVGAYEKWERLAVQNGVIVPGPKKAFQIGSDCRQKYLDDNKGKVPVPFQCPGGWMFGATWALPLEWILQINGVPEICDGQGFEDVQTGLLLERNGFPMRYDPRAKIIEDRTEGKLGAVLRHEDKGVSPNDKSHALLKMFQDPAVKRAIHTPGWDIDLRKIRADVLAGKPWPVPPAIEYKDWYDGQPIKEFK